MALVGSPIGKPWGRRLPVSLGGIVGKNYADFQAQITTLAAQGPVSWSGGGSGYGKFKTTAAAETGVMFGSSWLSGWRLGLSAVARFVQHGLPSQAEFNSQVASGRDIYFEVQGLGDLDVFDGLTRNGYVSSARAQGGGPEATGYMTDLIYWDGTQAQRMNPRTGTGPTPYTW